MDRSAEVPAGASAVELSAVLQLGRLEALVEPAAE